jgi:acyl CoA:acetate/3-ketoacid CoA transferase alpha subunit
VPENLISAIRDLGVGQLTVVSSNVGTGERGLGLLFQTGQISKVISAYVGENDVFERQFLNGQIEVELVPMGTLAERMRCAGAGIPAFFTKTGAGTLVHHGGMPQRYSADGARTVVQASSPRESRRFPVPFGGAGDDQADYIMEEALHGDFALVKAWRGDPEGNLVYRKTARNHNPPVATAGRITIAEVEEIVPSGSLDPDMVHTPGTHIDLLSPIHPALGAPSTQMHNTQKGINTSSR